MTPRLATLALLLAAACSNITPTKTVDLCEGDSWSHNCAACTGKLLDPHCEQCKGSSPAAACKNSDAGSTATGGANGGSGSGNGGKGGASGSSGTGGGGTSGGGAGSGGAGGTGGSGMDAGKDAGPCGMECPSDKPVCVAGSCEQCGGNDDCQKANLTRCEPATHTCVQCLGKTDCSGGTPECDTSAGVNACVECLGKTDCVTTSKPLCEPTAHGCVECLVDADCKDPTQPQCNNHTCGACTGDSACASRSATPHCDTQTSSASAGQCVQCTVHADCTTAASPECAGRTCQACTSDNACTDRAGTTVCETESAAPMHGKCVQCTPTKRTACSANACKRADDTCTSTPYQSLLPCAPCVTDGECVSGARCVVHDFDSTHHLGPYCFYDRGQTGACADGTHAAYRPYSNAVTKASIDDASSTYCLPPSTTTCAGIAAGTAQGGSGGKSCVLSTDCGESDLADGICGDATNGAADGKCTYSCALNPDCPQSGFTTCPTSGTKVCQ
ncbi:MAG: hypothetical protein ACHQ53_08865 [Polyangiales bacterium]